MTDFITDPIAELIVLPGQLSEPQSRHEQFCLRVRDDEVSGWRAAAEHAGASSLSGWFRQLADEAARTGHDPQAWLQAAMDLQRTLSGVANNLNQIAKNLNTMRKAGKSSDFADAAGSVLKMSEEVENTIQMLQNLLSGKRAKRRSRTARQKSLTNTDTAAVTT